MAKTSVQEQILSKGTRIAQWASRIALLIVFIVNVRCALQFIFTPEGFLTYYELNGTSGIVALQGIGVAFLMWNTTYPFAIVKPAQFKLVYLIVLIQQTVGLIGETFILIGIGTGHEVLTASIQRFIVFDAAGLLLMLATFIWLRISLSKANKRSSYHKQTS